MPDTATHPLRTPHAEPVVFPAGSLQAGSAKQSVLTLRNLSKQRVRLARMVGRGCFVRLPGTQAVFSIRPADDAGVEWCDSLFLETSGGPIEIADGARLILGLTGIHPGALQSMHEERRQWFAAALAGRLAGTPFADARIAAAGVTMDVEDSCCLRLTLRSRRHILTMLARAPVSAWLDFLPRSDWSLERTPAPDLLMTAHQETVRIAQHTLPSGVLRTLTPGDVIVPDSPFFRSDGEGRMRLGNRIVRVRYTEPNSLEILDVEGKVMTENPESQTETAAAHVPRDETADDAEAAGDATAGLRSDAENGVQEQIQEQVQAQAPEQVQDEAQSEAEAIAAEIDAAATEESLAVGDQEDAHGDLDSVPITLSFELGKVSLPLAEVRTLGPGAVVLFAGGSPASVAIVSAGQTLGRGELVDVEGQLGIRVAEWRTLC